jgi:DNA-binding NarL/FixJ family response regulator
MSAKECSSSIPVLRKMPIKILVVDDYQPVRQLVCSVLDQRAGFQVIAQAADGLDAVKKAQELQPDLIVLDIGLPKVNGIAAARQIRKLAPKSKILFLSQETDLGIVKASLGTGASGYVVKSDLGKELSEALEAVIQDGRFVSRRLAECIFDDIKNTRTRSSQFRREGSASMLLPQERETHIHQVQFYSHEARFLDIFADFITTVLNAGNVVIVVATPSHRNNLFSKLQATGMNVSAAIEQQNYIALDVAETLSTFMVNGLPVPGQFSKVVGDLIVRTAKAAKGDAPRVAACGEWAPVLWAQGKGEAAVRLEQLWDGIAKTYDVDILCSYPLLDFLAEEGPDMFQRICAEHTTVYSH